MTGLTSCFLTTNKNKNHHHHTERQSTVNKHTRHTVHCTLQQYHNSMSSPSDYHNTSVSSHGSNNSNLRGQAFGMDSFSSVDDTTSENLTAKPHAFAGAILTPKHARELTPSLCLAITSALAEQAYRKDAIPYTSWITEAWRVLGWSEPRYVWCLP